MSPLTCFRLALIYLWVWFTLEQGWIYLLKAPGAVLWCWDPVKTQTQCSPRFLTQQMFPCLSIGGHFFKLKTKDRCEKVFLVNQKSLKMHMLFKQGSGLEPQRTVEF